MTEFQVVVNQMHQLQHLSCLVIKDFSDTSGRFYELMHKDNIIKLLLRSISKELTSLQKKLLVLGDSHATIEQELEQLAN